MQERIKQIRKYFRLTQEEFGLKINLTKFAISNYENGRTRIPERVINDIIREFNVNETWLRTGEGDMFNETSSEKEIPLDDFFRVYTNLPPKDKKLIYEIMEYMVAQNQGNKNPPRCW